MYALLRPLLFRLDPAKAHALAMSALGAVEHLAPLRAALRRDFDPRLRVRAMGLDFPSPIGLAGGFDKNGERAVALEALGFGHLEIGTVTALAQEANPAPNLFRLPADRALVNRLGFPNEGATVVAARIAARKSRIGVPVGVSIGKSRAVPLEPLEGAIADYLASFRAVREVADFVVVNVSSPNTKDLRALQAAEVARSLFEALVRERDREGDHDAAQSRVPILVKIAPDLADDAIDAVCDAARDAKLAGVVATNTTIARDGLGLVTPRDAVESIGAGGLSGLPLRARALDVVRRVRARVGAGMCVVGVGGIDCADAALAMMRAGADLVQLYTAFVYEGPLLPRRIARDLAHKMDDARAGSLAEIVGAH